MAYVLLVTVTKVKAKAMLKSFPEAAGVPWAHNWAVKLLYKALGRAHPITRVVRKNLASMPQG